MTDPDEKIDYLEQHIPDLARAAVTQAYWASLAAGNRVLVIEDGAIYEVSPDGSRTFIKEAEPAVAVEVGAKRILP